MSYYSNAILEAQVDELAEKIIKRYKGYGVHIAIKNKDITILKDRFKFKIKLLPGTRVDQLDKYAKDVQIPLKLPLFQVIQEGLAIFIIASKEIIKNNNLLNILKTSEYIAAKKIMKIPHPIGFDATNKPVIADLALYPHLMICGTTGSGKSMALKSLLLSIGTYPPDKINFLICDKAGELSSFAKLPHLSYPIIQDYKVFLNIMLMLKQEMELRIDMKHSKKFSHLPSIICVIDEFLSFISTPADKAESKLLQDTLSDILRRGRHARIHMILAAHNPTKQNMKIDISDIPSKLVFRVAKFNNSVTSIGETGAEKLMGKGDSLFQSSQNDKLQRIQGAFIAPEDIEGLVNQIQSHYNSKMPKQKDDTKIPLKGFILNETNLKQVNAETDDKLINTPMINTKQNNDDALFVRITLWTLEHDQISCNKIIETFNIGWPRAKRFLQKLHEFGIVEDIYGKLPRPVIPVNCNDIPAEGMKFLAKRGISIDDIAAAIRNRERNQ